MSDGQRDFFKKYEIDVIDSNKRHSRRVGYSFFQEPDDKDIITTEHNYTTEPLLTITIPQSQLDNLMQLYEIVYNNRHIMGHNDMFQIVLDQIQEERSLRQQYPALKELHEQYSTILHLVGFQKKISL